MKKLIIFLSLTALSVWGFTPAQAATIKVTLTTIQRDTAFHYFESEFIQANANKDCQGALEKLINKSGSGPIFASPLVKLGSAIKVKNENGKTVGLGKITKGTYQKTEVQTGTDWKGDPYVLIVGRCLFTSTISLKSATFYEFNIGKSEPIDVSYTQLKKQKWKVTLYAD